jgi:hypothetical protein
VGSSEGENEPAAEATGFHQVRVARRAAGEPHAAWDTTAYREWTSMSWKITHFRPPVSTRSVASSCQHYLQTHRLHHAVRADRPFIGSHRPAVGAELSLMS